MSGFQKEEVNESIFCHSQSGCEGLYEDECMATAQRCPTTRSSHFRRCCCWCSSLRACLESPIRRLTRSCARRPACPHKVFKHRDRKATFIMIETGNDFGEFRQQIRLHGNARPVGRSLAFWSHLFGDRRSSTTAICAEPCLGSRAGSSTRRRVEFHHEAVLSFGMIVVFAFCCSSPW